MAIFACELAWCEYFLGGSVLGNYDRGAQCKLHATRTRCPTLSTLVLTWLASTCEVAQLSSWSYKVPTGSLQMSGPNAFPGSLHETSTSSTFITSSRKKSTQTVLSKARPLLPTIFVHPTQSRCVDQYSVLHADFVTLLDGKGVPISRVATHHLQTTAATISRLMVIGGTRSTEDGVFSKVACVRPAVAVKSTVPLVKGLTLLWVTLVRVQG